MSTNYKHSAVLTESGFASHVENINSWPKRFFDIVLGTVLALAITPLIIIVAILGLFLEGWPLLHIQDRIGLHGTILRLPKIRTMHVDANATQDEVLGVVIERTPEQYQGDSRISAYGRFLRRYSLDEMPQIFCVLSGSMSLVGPRPILISEQESLTESQGRRHLIKPGLTGLWQVSGRKDVSWAQRMDLDLQYIQDWSLLGDLKIVLRTFRAVIEGHGAY